jgi:hypothetical protein
LREEKQFKAKRENLENSEARSQNRNVLRISYIVKKDNVERLAYSKESKNQKRKAQNHSSKLKIKELFFIVLLNLPLKMHNGLAY